MAVKAGYSPTSSPLSMVDSDDEYMSLYDDASRPSKRPRLDARSQASTAAVHHDALPPSLHVDGLSDLSSDTSGDIPSSPINARLDEEDFQDQVTVCDWDGCPAGDQGNMDKLVDHIHNSHIENRQKKYTCEWKSCSRKGMPHASGYALKAHMRSHTREKPFYCYLPECDRSFTRSDALAKHMRTVHETEALRPSDPVPKSMQSGPTGKSGKLKIIIKTPQSHGVGSEDGADGATNGDEANPEYFTPLPSEHFSSEELAFPVDKLYRKCYWELKWAEEIGEALTKECKIWEDYYHKEWLDKEVLLSRTLQSEISWHDDRAKIISGAADVQLPPSKPADAEKEAVDDKNGGGEERPSEREPSRSASKGPREKSPTKS